MPNENWLDLLVAGLLIMVMFVTSFFLVGASAPIYAIILVCTAIGLYIGARIQSHRLSSRVLETTQLKVVAAKGLTVDEAYAQYYASTDTFDCGALAYVWGLPQTYRIGNGPVTMIAKDSKGVFWIFSYGFEKFLEEPYREHSGDPMLKGAMVNGEYKLPEVALVVYH